MAVVRRDERNVGFLTDLNQKGKDAFFILDAVIHDFDEVVALAENALHLAGMGACGVKIAIQQQLVQLAGQAGARRDQALGVFAERRHIDTRAIIETTRPALADQLGQILIAFLRFAQQDEVVHRTHAVCGAAIIHVIADIDFASDDGMDSALLCLGIKIHHAVHGAVVGDGAGVHAQFFDAVEQRPDAVCAVQETVFGVQMKMCESHSVMLLVIR